MEINPKKLMHSGKKMAYPSCFVWVCPDCVTHNTWHTKMLMGKANVICQSCFAKHILNKSKPLEVVTRTKNDNLSIFD